ncbi:MAG: uracil-DNA glycosylase [Nitrospinaceae bacterium]
MREPLPAWPPDATSCYADLVAEAASCRRCPALAAQPAVLGKNNGSLRARVVFVAEAPGRCGAGRTGIPFCGDQSGDNFQALIDHIGLSRQEIFITNAVLCNPLADGCNRGPVAAEVANCTYFLDAVLSLIRPPLVVTLGTVGLAAVNRLLGTGYRLKDDVGRLQSTSRFGLIPLYHPSPRVTHWRRPLSQQKRDFRRIVQTLRGQP